MTYLLDTDAFSDLVRGVPNVKGRFSLVGLSSVRISTVSVKEIEFGRQRHPERMTRPVSDGRKNVRDLYVVEIRIPAARRTLLFATGSQEVYVKTDAGKKKLSAFEIQQELLRRLSIEPPF
jgi:predicted nucleic acid-binding protein